MSVVCLLQKEASQVKKVIQLLETMMVRHGLMLVGPTGGGKTTTYEVRIQMCTHTTYVHTYVCAYATDFILCYIYWYFVTV